MNKKIFMWLLNAFLLATAPLALAQQPTKIPRVGILLPPSASFISTWVEAFRQRLGELGYVEGKNISIDYRYAEGKPERLPGLAVELVRLKVDVILTGSIAGVLAAKKASASIPIVFGAAPDPVGAGLVSSLAKPGGNITGLSLMAPDLDSKRLELLKEAFPKVARVALLWEPTNVRGDLATEDIEAAAKVLGVKLQSLPVRGLDEIDGTFERAKKDGAQALLTTPSPIINTQQSRLLDFAAKNRLPAMYSNKEFVEAGGLMSYAPSYADLFRRAADFIDKIIKGAKPADLPVEQPIKFEFVINLKTAKALNLNIPQSVLFRADKVIK